jgi:hypothetical protein
VNNTEPSYTYSSNKNVQKVLNYIPFFSNISEDDYIIYNDDHSFEYTPAIYEFIKALFDANLVEDFEKMQGFIENYDCKVDSCNNYNNWMRDMNRIICRSDLLNEADITFIRKAFLTLIRLEKVIPGSWGIDIEVGTWLKLLRRLKGIYQTE